MSTDTILVNDEEISLTDLLGLDMSDIEEFRATSTPAGKWHWRIMDAKTEVREDVKDFDNPDEGKVNRAFVIFELQAQNCYALVDDKLSPDMFVDRKHTLSFKIVDHLKDLGKVQAFLSDIGMKGDKSLEDLLSEAHGLDFISDTTNRPNKDNPEYVFVNLKNIEPYSEEAEKAALGTD